MRCIVAAVIFTVSVPVLAHAEPVIQQVSFQPQVKSLRCLKPEAVAMIRELVEKIGAIEITSTCGGRHARHSQHYSGKAIDFRPLATTPRKAAAIAKTLDNVGGVGSYSNGLVHVDVGDRQLAWYGIKRASRRYAYNARR